MNGLKIGYARVSTDEQDLSAQLAALAELGVGTDRIYVDKGLTGTNSLTTSLSERPKRCWSRAARKVKPTGQPVRL